MVTTFSILKQLPKSWASTMKLQKQIANQKWLRTTGMRFDMQFLRMRIESEHKHIQYAQEKKIIISKEHEDFMEDYECIVYKRLSPDL
jgi:hypothetical protein